MGTFVYMWHGSVGQEMIAKYEGLRRGTAGNTFVFQVDIPSSCIIVASYPHMCPVLSCCAWACWARCGFSPEDGWLALPLGGRFDAWARCDARLSASTLSISSGMGVAPSLLLLPEDYMRLCKGMQVCVQHRQSAPGQLLSGVACSARSPEGSCTRPHGHCDDAGTM